MSLQAFRNSVIQIAQPLSSYRPLKTEMTGIGNIAAGIAQIVAGNIMKYQEDPANNQKQSTRHIQRGTTAIKLGIKQFLPGTIVLCAVGYIYRRWSQL